jgi:hypothetical protein
MRSPLLFIVFNRPETTRQVFEAIRSARPPRLYIAADGPRLDRIGEAERCSEVRAIASSVDWSCDVKTLYRSSNLGCKAGVSSAINWFFSHDVEGVILEDDILPTRTFFQYCDELLERYRDDERVGLISGCNLISSRHEVRTSYFFSRYNHIWGWASWRRAWKHYDVSMSHWPKWRDGGGLATVSAGSRRFERYWRQTFDRAHAGAVDTWDYQWTFACWRTGMLAALPHRNQQANLGFGCDATHTTSGAPRYVRESPPVELDFPLVHPTVVKPDVAADRLVGRHVFGLSYGREVRSMLGNAPVLGSALRRVKDVLAR